MIHRICSELKDDLPANYPAIVHEYDIWHWANVSFVIGSLNLTLINVLFRQYRKTCGLHPD